MKLSLLLLLSSGPLFAQQMTTNLPVNKSAQVLSQSGTSLHKMKTQPNLNRLLQESSTSNFKNKTTYQNKRSSNLRLQGGADPGGGGAYKINGELKTLAEAGAILEKASQLGSKTYPKYYTLKAETVEALKDIVSKLPQFKIPYTSNHFASFTQAVIGKRDTFIDQNDVSKPDYEKIKADYRKAIKASNKKLDESAFVLVAYGKPDSGKTYILPAFEDLTPYQQALMLIHEYFMRQKYDMPTSARLELVLNLDVIILDILKNGKTDESTLRFLTALDKLKGVEKEDIGYHRLAILEKKLGRPLFASELVLEPGGRFWAGMYGEANRFDPSLIQKFESQMPGIAEFFESWILFNGASSIWKIDPRAVEPNEVQYEARLQKEINDLCQTFNPESTGVDSDFLITSNWIEGYLIQIDCGYALFSKQLRLKERRKD